MSKNDLVIQNNVLRLFLYGEKQGKSLNSYVKRLLNAEEMENLLSGIAYREDALLKVIDRYGRAGVSYGYEFYLYYSHCLIYLRRTTFLPSSRFHEWADVEEIAKGYDYYHTHSDEMAFEEMCLARLRRRKEKSYDYNLFDYCSRLDAPKRLRVAAKILRFCFPYLYLENPRDYFDEQTSSMGYLFSNGKMLLVLDESSFHKIEEQPLPSTFVFTLSSPKKGTGFYLDKEENVLVSSELENIAFSLPFREVRL
jgi:hypothetical protein